MHAERFAKPVAYLLPPKGGSYGEESSSNRGGVRSFRGGVRSFRGGIPKLSWLTAFRRKPNCVTITRDRRFLTPVPRYRFSEFILSPRRRMLLRNGHEQPLIPRYFDLLVFLIERRGEAVHRRDIFDRVWSDVVVSDSALSQAIRTIRRVLGDDSREPRFVRTVSRHGYRFVFADVVEEDDESEWQVADGGTARSGRSATRAS